MGARPLFVLKDACRSLYPIGFVISTQYTSHRKSIQNHEGGRRRALGNLCRNRLRILPSNKHGHHDGNKRDHHSRENRLPPVQPRHHREPHLQSAAIKKRIGGRCGAWGWYCVFSISDSFPLKCMVYFENKTRNHAKGFRIQKHLLPANESCVLILQNCCATDFRKTVIRFIACQVPAAFLHANSECLGAWPLSSRSRVGIPPTEHADAPHPPQNIAALEPKPRRRATSQRIQQSILRTARPSQEPIIRETPSRPPEICTSLIPFPLRERRISAP